MTDDEQTTSRTPVFRQMLKAIPSSSEEGSAGLEEEIAAGAKLAAQKRSEARRDAFSVVALAIVRRGQNPTTDATLKDAETFESIADQLTKLGQTT